MPEQMKCLCFHTGINIFMQTVHAGRRSIKNDRAKGRPEAVQIQQPSAKDMIIIMSNNKIK